MQCPLKSYIQFRAAQILGGLHIGREARRQRADKRHAGARHSIQVAAGASMAERHSPAHSHCTPLNPTFVAIFLIYCHANGHLSV